MQQIYQDILQAKANNNKLLAILLDPDKLNIENIEQLSSKINSSPATHIFVGGSIVSNGETKLIVLELKKHTSLPIILFPGNTNQVTNKADGILFLSLLSGRNPEYLIEQHVKAAPLLQKSDLEIIPTGYILIEGGVETAVQKVSNTLPIPKNDVNLIIHTALAGQYTGKQLIYLEAGSGATESVEIKTISLVANAIDVPLIVGGGIRSKNKIEAAYQAGADLVVIGTAFENDSDFFKK
ncbi:MAG: geranylgeranylglyceryl/heptaprenylglyceryl phosphate synthase [Flavobacteriaceae bacterium]|nr:geranylgeranylglyceryl/heptaprenylglyceryl phosphate synthase [Flavobacteriaceae bacterium]